MTNIFKEFINDKKKWKAMEARADALPEEYKYAYHRIQKYMWNLAAGHDAGVEMIAIFEGLLDLFEDGARNNSSVLEITGEDVAAFSDELLRSTDTYIATWREKLNRDIKTNLATLGENND